MNELTTAKTIEATELTMDDKVWDRMLVEVDMMSKGISTVPKHLQGNVGDCFAVVRQAYMWGMNAFAVAQKTHVINGTLGYEAQLVSAVIRRFLSDVPHYEWEGPWSDYIGKEPPPKALESELTCTVSVMIKGNTEPKALTLAMSQASVRNSPLWKTDPKQQLAYLCTKRIARLYLPGAILGVYTPDELEDIPQAPRDMGEIQPESRTATVRDKLAHQVEATRDKVESQIDEMQQQAINHLNEQIFLCGTMENLEKLGAEIKTQLPPVQDAVRDQYITRQRELRRQIEDKINPADIMKIVEGAPDVESLDDCAEMIKHMDKRKQPWKEINEAIQVRAREMVE